MSTTQQHPKGLRFLFLTEMWERFGYYLMIGIFMLYMKDTQKGGLSIPHKEATDIFGTFIALVYVTPFIGGMLADRVLGYRRSIIIGATLMGFGYLGLAIQGMTAFWISLLLIILGNGFFKPNISILLGNLYNDEPYKAHKDTGYNIFYMGINVGAFICNFFAAYLRNTFSWGHAFAAAGVGMFIGLAVFILGDKHYAHADIQAKKQENEQSIAVVMSSVLIPAILAGVLGWMIPGNIFGSDSTDAFLIACLPIIAFYLNIWFKAAAHEREPIAALLAIYAVVIVFWAIFKQNGTTLTNWAEYYTDRAVPTMLQTPADALGMTQTLTAKKDSFPHYDSKFRAPKDAAGKVVKTYSTHPYFINAPATLPAEGKSVQLFSTELFQSINPFFVVVLTPFVVWFFGRLRKRNIEPTTATKIAGGLFISGLSTIIMVFAVLACHNGLDKSSIGWLFGTYGVITVGELFLSPMGLSLVSKLAPVRISALMMGGWQLATAIGNKLSGVLAGLWDGYEDKTTFFWTNTGMIFAAAAVIFVMLRWLNRIIRQYVV